LSSSILIFVLLFLLLRISISLLASFSVLAPISIAVHIRNMFFLLRTPTYLFLLFKDK
jgi:hypothetical protein